MWALTNDRISGILTNIGGMESIRILPFIEDGVPRANERSLAKGNRLRCRAYLTKTIRVMQAQRLTVALIDHSAGFEATPERVRLGDLADFQQT